MTKDRVTIKDIAISANTSICTVNKALNGKPKISESKRKEILKIAEEMGYKVNKVAQSLKRKIIRIGILMPTDWPQFHKHLEQGLRNELERVKDYNFQGVFVYIPHNSHNIDNVIFKILKENISALVICPEYYHDLHKTMKYLNDLKIPIIVLGNDVPYGERLCFIGVEAYLSGRLAAEITKLFISSGRNAAIFIGFRDIETHQKKVEGFCAESKNANFTISGVYETKDNPESAIIELEQLIDKHPETQVIYVATGNSEKICEYIYQKSLDIKVIATDVFDAIIEYMNRGVIIATIFQNPIQQGERAIHVINTYFTENVLPQKKIYIPPTVVFKNNAKLFL
jgi:LacI family transcriptional regulator